MLKKLKQIPVPIAAAIMIICIAAGIALGNNNALKDAKAGAETSMAQVTELSLERAQKASNLLVLCERYAPDNVATVAIKNAVEAQKNAKTPSQIAEANRNLTDAAYAANEMLRAFVKDTDAKLLTGIMDDLGSYQKQLTRAANTYNADAAEAYAVYQKLPSRFLLGSYLEEYA